MLTYIVAQHQLWLVALAAVVCIGASVTTFTIYSHLLVQDSARRSIWLLLLGFCAGIGIWAADFLAGLAYNTGYVTSYDAGLTIASAAVLVTVATLGFAVSLSARRVMVAAGGAIVGLGMAAAHFLGMQAVVIAADFQWSLAFALPAVLLGTGLTIGALAAFRAQTGPQALFSAAALLAAAVCALHFIALGGLSIVWRPDLPAPAASLDGALFPIAIAVVTILLLAAGCAVTLIDGHAVRNGAVRTREVMEAATEALVLAHDGVIVHANAKALKLCGRKGDDLLGKTVFGDLLAVSTRPAAPGGTRPMKTSLHRSDGTAIPAEALRRPLHGAGRGNEIYAIRDLREVEEVTRRLDQANQELRQREDELWTRNLVLDGALKNMTQGLCMYDASQKVVISNERFATIYGLPANAIEPGMSLREVIQKRIDNGIYAGASPEAYMEERLAPLLKAEEQVHELNNGQVLAIARRPMPSGGWVTTHTDITEQRRIEAQITHLAHNDTLTGLLSRNSFREHLDERLQSEQKRDRRLAVLMLGVDRFSEINDTLGHAVGDSLLKAIAQRLEYWTRRATLLGRFGDDTFAIAEVVEHPGKDATGLAKRLQEEIRKPFPLGENTVEITATIGIAVSPADGKDANTLLHSAGLALHRGKFGVRGSYHFFQPGMETELRARRALEQELGEALAKRELELHYEPLVNLVRHEMTGFAALLRWRRPGKGLLPPESFLPLAEEMGLTTAIGEWALQQACADAAPLPKSLSIAVNLPAALICSQDFSGLVVRTLAATGLSANRLQIEISEKAVHSQTDQVAEALRALAKLGVLITLNNFGSGFSSLGYLRLLPVHGIKMDRSFLSDLSGQQDGQIIIRMLARLGAGLGLTTMVEGVATKEQLELITSGGYTEMQGPYISAPKTAEEMHRLFQPKPKEAVEVVA